MIAVPDEALFGRLMRRSPFPVLAFVWMLGGTVAAQTDEINNSGTTDEPRNGGLVVPLPEGIPDGRVFRSVGLYQSQLVELLPDSYWPVSVTRLRDALTRMRNRSTDDRTSRVKNAVYWVRIVDGRLESDRSTIDIETDESGIVRRSLGFTNLAISGPQLREGTVDLDRLPRMETDRNGNLLAVFRAEPNVRSDIEFKWQLRGQTAGLGHDYSMKLPPCPQTRIVLSAPSDLLVETLDGVLHTRLGPPPDAGEFIADSNTRWYEIDAGGLTSLMIRTRRATQTVDSETLIARRTSTKCEIDAGGLTWNSRIDVQLPPSRRLPPLSFRQSTITSVSVNGIETTYSVLAGKNQEYRLEIDVPAGSSTTSPNSATILLTGKAFWSVEKGWCDLPMPVWSGDQVIRASSVHDVQVVVPDDLQLLSWDLPSQWRQAANKSGPGTTLYSASGPPADDGHVADSRIRLSILPATSSEETLLLMDLSTRPLQAKASLSVKVDPNHVVPVHLQLQRGWSLDSVTLPISGREIEIAELNNASRSLVIWPEPRDAAGGTLQIEASGSSRSNLAVNSVPPTWFVRTRDTRGDLTAAIIAPPQLNWSGDSALKIDRVAPSTLSAPAQSFFAGVNEDSLVFHAKTDRTPPLSLRSPGVSFDVTTVLEFKREGAEVIESLVIDTDAATQVLANLTVQTGGPGDRPPYRWLLRSLDGSPPISLPPSDITAGEGDSAGQYTINLSDQNLRDRELVGRRRYTMNGDLSLQLPSVPKASSQSSEVHLGPGLIVKQTAPSVLKVPLTTDSVDLGTTGETGRDRLNDLDTSTRLRYDAVKQANIVIETSDRNPNVTIVWEEEIKVIASSRGTDRIEASYDVSAAGPFQIDHDPELQLVAVFRDEMPVDLITVPQRPIELEPNAPNEKIRLVWNRDQIGPSWFRRCRIPRVVISGVVVKSEYRLIASSDTFAPVALLQEPHSDTEHAIVMAPGDSVTLIRRNISLAAGWLLAGIVFSIAWYVSQRNCIATAAAIVLMLTAAILWWPWHMGIIGWLVVPTTAAALLVAATSWTDRGSTLGKRRSTDVDDASRRSSDATGSIAGDSHSMSWAKLGRTICFLVLIVGFLSTLAWSQEPSDALVQPDRHVNLLVPVDKTGARAGDIVYIPKDVFNDLFRSRTARTPIDARFQSATYQIKIESERATSESKDPQVVADYLIHIDEGESGFSSVRLPIQATAVNRIDLLGDVNKIIQPNADETGQLIVQLPPGNAFLLRLTLQPAIAVTDKWNRLFLTIPRVASSRLTVEADQNIRALRVGGSKGRLLDEQDLRRWVEEIGPVNSLEVEYQQPDRQAAVNSRPMDRRYWLSVSSHQAIIDCEIIPPNDVSEGQVFQLVVRDARLPKLATKTWALLGSELVSPNRRLISLKSLSDSPGPVRFLWTTAIESTPGSESLAVDLELPEVILPAAGENANAWIAIDAESSLRVTSGDVDLIDSLSVDHFLAAWSGYRGQKPQRAFIAVQRLPTLQVTPVARLESKVTQQHHLHVTASQMQLSYSATLTPGDDGHTPRTLRLPVGMRLLELSVDGRRLENRMIRSGQFNEVGLDFVDENTESTINARAVVQLLSNNRQFTPPQIEILPALATTEKYSMSRSRDVIVRNVVPPRIAPLQSTPNPSADSLVEGWIPEATWVFAPDSEVAAGKIGGRYRVNLRPTRFDCNQLISLFWADGQWNMEVKVRFRSRRIPDYIDVEIPTRWCESLDVMPADAWSQQPSIDPEFQIVRIRCEQEALRDGALSFRASLDDAGKGRVTVPDVKVLGNGVRSVDISVPTRLTNESISWRTSAVEAKPVNVVWKEEVESLGDRSTFFVANPDWSVELAPLPKIDSDAVALSADAKVFPQSDAALVVCRWDLIPGGLDSVEVAMPQGATCLGAWTAGRAVVATPVGLKPDAGDDPPNLIRVPLSLSRLGQSVELLIHVPIAQARQADYLPKLKTVPVLQKWLSLWTPTSTASKGQLPEETRRALAIAKSVVEAVEQSVDLLAELPKDEISIWLAPWVVRYRAIANSAGHFPNLNVPPQGFGQFDRTFSPIEKQWADLDRRLSVQARQYLLDDPRNIDSMLRLHDISGYSLSKITRVSVNTRVPAILPATTSGDGLRTIIVNLLTLMLVAGLLACLWPFRRYVEAIVVHPAFWLGTMGLIGFAVAPIPVAAAVVFTAVTLPAIPRSQRRRKRASL